MTRQKKNYVYGKNNLRIFRDSFSTLIFVQFEKLRKNLLLKKISETTGH